MRCTQCCDRLVLQDLAELAGERMASCTGLWNDNIMSFWQSQEGIMPAGAGYFFLFYFNWLSGVLRAAGYALRTRSIIKLAA